MTDRCSAILRVVCCGLLLTPVAAGQNNLETNKAHHASPNNAIILAQNNSVTWMASVRRLEEDLFAIRKKSQGSSTQYLSQSGREQIGRAQENAGNVRNQESDTSREEWEYKDAYLFWLRQRAFPGDTVNWLAYVRAFQVQAEMPRLLMHNPSAAYGLIAPELPRWQFVGPNNLPVPYRQFYGQGFTSGRVNGVAFDPTDAGTVYLASAGGGLWKCTTDVAGRNCKALGDSWDNTKLSSVTIDPTDHNTIYVGTGDFDGGFGVYGFGIMKSTNGGVTWSNQARAELKGFSVRSIMVDPDNPQILTVAAGRNPFEFGKLLRSSNGGLTWQLVSNATRAEWEDIKCSVKRGVSGRLCFAVGGSQGGEILRTADQGRHWTKLYPPLSSSCFQATLAVATSPTLPNTVYLLSGVDKTVLMSGDGGDSWTDITGNLPNGSEVIGIDRNYNWSQSDYDFLIEASRDPKTNQDIIYVGLIDLVASIDGGKSWVSVGKTYDPKLAWTHNDQHSLVVDPANPNVLLLGNDGGAYIVEYYPSKKHWSFNSAINSQLGLTQLYKLSTHPMNQEFILGGAQDNASPVSLGDLANWSNIGGGDGGFVAINPRHPEIQYATEQYLGVYRTVTSWANWKSDKPGDITYVDNNGNSWSGDPTSFIAPIALDPSNPNLLYAGTNYLWRWNEEAVGDGWSAGRHLGGQMLAEPSAPSEPNIGKDAISIITVAPSDGKVIYTGSQTGELWVSRTSGNHWSRLGGTSGLPQYWITSIAVHPTVADVILVGLSGTSGPGSEHPGHLWKCAKTSSSQPICTNLSGIGSGKLPNIPINAVLIDPRRPDKVYYVATDIGVFMTLDGGSTWGDATKPLGLPNVQVNDLQFVPGTDYMLAGTFGRGIWRIGNLSAATLQPRIGAPAAYRRGASRISVPK